jgi:sialate O-acetylesterase
VLSSRIPYVVGAPVLQPPAMTLVGSLAAAALCVSAMCVSAVASAAAAAAAAAPCSITYNSTMGDYMVLQQAPALSAVFGAVAGGATSVSVKVTDGAGGSYSVDAVVSGGLWKALLHAAPAGGNYTVAATATCSAGQASAVISNVVFGDVWYCGGQSA